MRIDTRWAANNADIRKYAADLVAPAPDVILAHGSNTVGQLLQASHTVPMYSRSSLIRSLVASLTAWRGRAASASLTLIIHAEVGPPSNSIRRRLDPIIAVHFQCCEPREQNLAR